MTCARARASSSNFHSAELTTLLNGLLARRAVFERFGVVYGTHEVVLKDNLPEVVRAIVDSPESELATVLDELTSDEVLNLGRRVDLSKLDALLAEWRENDANSNEEFWQDLLKQNAWVFSQLTGAPVVLLEDKAYVGGKTLANKEGGQVDYLVQNELTDNVALIEIKTPVADLCGARYRTSGAYKIGSDVIGGLVQVQGYRESFEREYYSLLGNDARQFRAHAPRCYVIVGTTSSLDEDDKVASFERFRNSLMGVEVLTFDEVETRLQGIRDALTTDDEA
jgi:hypothetical protein